MNKLNTIADLPRKRFGVIRGWRYGDDFDKAVKADNITVDQVKSDDQNFQKLAAGWVDAILAIDKKAKQTELLAKFNKAIGELKKSGKLEKISNDELGK